MKTKKVLSEIKKASLKVNRLQNKILRANLSRNRTDSERRNLSDVKNFNLWKRCYPDTHKNILRSMTEYAFIVGKSK